MNFDKATILSLMTYLEELEAEASVQKMRLKDYLQKRSNKIPMPIYKILYNTVLEAENQGLKINGETIFNEPDMTVSPTQVISINDTNAKFFIPKNLKELTSWFNDRIEYDIKGYNEVKGYRFVPLDILGENGKEGEYFDWNFHTEVLTIMDNDTRKYHFGKDFDIVATYKATGIYLLKDYSTDMYQIVDIIKLEA